MSLDDKDIWEYLRNQDQYIIQEFGMGIVGIGALFFAFGQIDTLFVKEIVAWIGMFGSFILFMHMYGARKEFYAITDQLRKNNGNEDFFTKLDVARSWRKNDWYRVLYYPVTMLMTYFMGLVTWAWIVIILHTHNVSKDLILFLTVAVLVLSIAIAIAWRVRNITKKEPQQPTE